MSEITENIAAILTDFRREQSGTSVLFRGLPFAVRTEETSGAVAGQQGVPRTGLNEFIADTVPRVFVFSQADFDALGMGLPRVGEFILSLGFSYEITSVTADTASDVSFGIFVRGLKKVW